MNIIENCLPSPPGVVVDRQVLDKPAAVQQQSHKCSIIEQACY